MPSEGDLAALSPEEQAKAKQTARSKAYGRLATLYNERGADQELVRAPAVGEDKDLPEVTEESQAPAAGAPSPEEVLNALEDSYNKLHEAVPDNDPLSGARDKLQKSMQTAVSRWKSGEDDDETFAQNLDLIKEYANAQEPAFKPSYAKKNPAEEAFGHFAEDLDDIHASIGGHDNVDQAKSALSSVASLIQSEVDATDMTEDGSPMGWSPVLEELHTEVAAVQKNLDDGFYLNEPEKLINDLQSLSEALDKQSEHLDAEGLDQTKAELAEAAQNLATEPGDAPDTAPDTDESTDGPATPAETPENAPESAPESAPEATPAPETAPETPHAPTEEPPAPAEAPEADAEVPGDPADYTDAPEGADDAEKGAWDAYSDVAGAISDLLQEDALPGDTSDVDSALFKFQGLLNDWYEEAPDSPDAIESFWHQFDEAAAEVGNAYEKAGADKSKLEALDTAANDFHNKLSELHDAKLAGDQDNPDNADAPDAQSAPDAAPSPDETQQPPSEESSLMSALNRVAEDLITLKEQLDEGDPLNNEFSHAANEVANIGKNFEQGNFISEDASSYLDNTISDLSDLFEDPTYGKQLASGDGGQLGDDLEDSISELNKISDKLNNGGFGAGNNDEPPTANDDSADDGEFYDDGTGYGYLSAAEEAAFLEAEANLNKWFDSTEASMADEPDFEAGQGAGWVPPEKAQEDFATFRQELTHAIDKYTNGDTGDNEFSAEVEAAQNAWTNSEGFKQWTSHDEDGAFSEDASGSEQIDALMEAAGFSASSSSSANAADDPWAQIHEDAAKAADELPDAETVHAQAPTAEEAFNNLTDAMKPLANGHDSDTPDNFQDVNAAHNVLDDKLQEVADSPETGPDQKDFVVGAQQHTDEVVNSLTDAFPDTSS
jgi:hypothetical protein